MSSLEYSYSFSDELQQEWEWSERYAGQPELERYNAFTDLLLDERANAALEAFYREKLVQRVRKPGIADKLTPRGHPVLTRRLAGDSGYVEAFDRDNVDLVDLAEEPIRRFTQDGVVVGEREILLDAVIFATGFDVGAGAIARIDVRGRGGQSLRDAWAQGFKTHLAIMAAGFRIRQDAPLGVLLGRLAAVYEAVRRGAGKRGELSLRGRVGSGRLKIRRRALIPKNWRRGPAPTRAKARTLWSSETGHKIAMENKLGAAEFKATCLSVLEEVARSRRPVTITKRGKPVARLVPMDARADAPNPLDGSLLWEKDIVGPFHEEWEAAK